MKKIIGLSVFVFGLLLVAGNVSAAPVAEQLQPASDVTYTETVIVPSIKVGAQGVGGVTFFNGTIVNSTTNDGVDNPVTFGDNVRIDGRVFRGETYGPGLDDDRPFVINDDVQITGSLTMATEDSDSDSDSGTTTVTVGDITSVVAGSGVSVSGGSSGAATVSVSDGGINTARLASNAVTSAKIANETIVSADIDDGTIVDADISNNTNITANNFNYRTDKTRYYTVLGSEFNTAYHNSPYTISSGYITNATFPLYTGVHLPDGATITRVDALLYDAAGTNIDVDLRRCGDTMNCNVVANLMAAIDSSGTDGWGTFSDTSIIEPVVDNDNYTYSLIADPDDASDHRVGKVKITYTVSSAY